MQQIEAPTRRNRAKDKYIHQEFSAVPAVRKKITKQEPFKRASFTHSPISDETINNFFSQLSISDISPFMSTTRSPCPQCASPSIHFCRKCLVSLPGLTFPQVNLPIPLTIIHHKQEKIAKSSAIPLCFLAQPVPEVVQFPLQSPCGLDDLNGTYFLYPHKDAKTLSQMDSQERQQIKKIVAIDCTWKQTKPLMDSLVARYKEENLRFIKLETYESVFWRFNQHGKACLSSAEAIHYFYKEHSKQTKVEGQQEKGIDDLLFFFKVQYKHIQESNNWRAQVQP